MDVYYGGNPIDVNKTIKLIKDGKIKFPYRKYLMKEEEVVNKFNNLKNYKYKLLKGYKYDVINLKDQEYLNKTKIAQYRGEYVLLVKEPSDYINYNILSDYFNEKCRMKCKRYDAKINPHTLFYKYPDKVLHYARKRYGKKITINEVREAIYRLAKECSSFRPTIIVSFIDMFNVKKILDFSSGWGDRLIGAIAKDVYYYGIDPNPCLHDGYKKIINMLAKDKSKYEVILSGFETAPLPPFTYDMVFTSPPYFTLEKYTEEGKQSIEKYKELDDWLNNFLYYSIDKAWSKLEINGHVVLIINNIRHYPDYIEKMVKRQTKIYLDDMTFSKYLGRIGYAERVKDGYKSPQPIWIWKKVPVDSIFNPPVIIKDVKYNDKTFHIIRDDKLDLGTYGRFLYNGKIDTQDKYILNVLNKMEKMIKKQNENNLQDVAVEQLKKSYKISGLKRIWIYDDGHIGQIIKSLFPDANIISIGYSHDSKLKYKLKEKLDEPAKYIPPYKTILRADAKIWRFVQKYGKNGDYVLNRGKDTNI